MGSEESSAGLLRVLVDRCSELKATQASLRAQLDELAAEEQSRREKEASPPSSSGGGGGGLTLPGNFGGRSPCAHVLQSMGHAVYVTRAPSGEIIFWNYSAEKLYGWKDHEAIGRCFWDLLTDEEYAPQINKIMEKLRFGQSWSGQFPFKKRCGEIFMAIVTKSPLYEDGQLVGVITVSSDAAVFNNVSSNQHREQHGFNMKWIPWQPRPQIASVPQMASSISDLASKVLSRRRGDDAPRNGEGSASDAEDAHPARHEVPGEGHYCHKEESVIAQPAKIAAKLLAKFQKNNGNNGEANGGNFKRTSTMRKANHEPCCTQGCSQTTSHTRTIDGRGSSFHGLHVDDKGVKPALENPKSGETEDAAERQAGARNFPSSGESRGSSRGSSSSKGEIEPNALVDPDIRWEDLQVGEEVGQGSYAVVYHGLWNGSDVAIKVYFGKDYNEGTLLDYKKEIDIMRRLRHPNVLLFMGACYSQERLAIVTEFLPRGSLFKILHRSNQVLDVRKRLKMALDVARGMNYLHCRHPPIVHRDLKSSNLLVDKNWTVKVGDFGLSKLKNATFLTAKSGGGTPQWMAPEVLRNDPSNEKSDVFSFGVILWELMTVSIPWANLNSLQVVGVVGFMDRRLDIPENVDPRISSIIRDCWRSKPDLRPSFQEIIQRMNGILQTVPAAIPTPVRRNQPS